MGVPMEGKVLFLDVLRQERELKRQFKTDYTLAATFYFAKRLHAEELGEKEGALFSLNPATLKRWMQKRLADEVEDRNIRVASVYRMVPYVTQLLTNRQAIRLWEWAPTKKIEHYEATNNEFELLRIAEESFLVFCFNPEERKRGLMNERQYAGGVGTHAYRVFGYGRKNPLGRDMEEAFVPLGELVREMFIRHS